MYEEEDTDTLKMFDGFEKEIESFKGNEETWRKVHAVGGADSFGWSIWRLGIRGLSIGGDGRESVKAHSEIQS